MLLSPFLLLEVKVCKKTRLQKNKCHFLNINNTYKADMKSGPLSCVSFMYCFLYLFIGSVSYKSEKTEQENSAGYTYI